MGRFPGLFLIVLLLMIVSTGNVYSQSKKERLREAAKSKNTSSSQKGIDEARQLLLGGNPFESLMAYSTMVSLDSSNVALSCEYAYVLAVTGNFDAALFRIDDIWPNRFLYPEIPYFASQIFSLMGNGEAASAINEAFPGRKDPAWVSANAIVLSEKYMPAKTASILHVDKAPEIFSRANRLTSRGSYLQAVSLYYEINSSYPDEYLPQVGYSIALEKAGLNRLAADVLEKAIRILDKDPGKAGDKAILEKRFASLRVKQSEAPKAYIGKVLEGASLKKSSPRLMAYAGGMVSPSYTNMNGRFGYFLSGSGNASVDLGISSVSGNTSYNLGMTYYKRHKVLVAGFGLAGNFTGNTSAAFLKISVGFSFQSRNQVSSWDIFWDGMAPFSKTQPTTVGFSAGRSMYFGKRN